jgi:hypothetical protein
MRCALGAVRVLSCVGHRKDARAIVHHREVLVLELSSIDGLATRAIHVLKVAALHHEALYHAVKDGVAKVEGLATLEPQTPLARAQAAEVLRCLWHHICKELDHQAAGAPPADLQVEEYSWIDIRVVGSVGVLGEREELGGAFGRRGERRHASASGAGRSWPAAERVARSASRACARRARAFAAPPRPTTSFRN